MYNMVPWYLDPLDPSFRTSRMAPSRSAGMILMGGRMCQSVTWKMFECSACPTSQAGPLGLPFREDSGSAKFIHSSSLRFQHISTYSNIFQLVVFVFCIFLLPGDLVVALFEEDYEWYNATVVEDKGGSFLVLWDDPDGGPELATCIPEHLRTLGISKKEGKLIQFGAQHEKKPISWLMYRYTITNIC